MPNVQLGMVSPQQRSATRRDIARKLTLSAVPRQPFTGLTRSYEFCDGCHLTGLEPTTGTRREAVL